MKKTKPRIRQPSWLDVALQALAAPQREHRLNETEFRLALAERLRAGDTKTIEALAQMLDKESASRWKLCFKKRRGNPKTGWQTDSEHYFIFRTVERHLKSLRAQGVDSPITRAQEKAFRELCKTRSKLSLRLVQEAWKRYSALAV